MEEILRLTKELWRQRLQQIEAEAKQLRKWLGDPEPAISKSSSSSPKKIGGPVAKKSPSIARLKSAGGKAIRLLKAKTGEYVASAMLAEAIGTSRVGDAIKATGVAVESRGPGRGKEYRIKS